MLSRQVPVMLPTKPLQEPHSAFLLISFAPILFLLLSYTVYRSLRHAFSTPWSTKGTQSYSSSFKNKTALSAARYILDNSTLASRASSNIILSHVFRLHNPFVSSSPDLQSAYRRTLSSHFRTTSWPKVARAAAEAISSHLEEVQPNTQGVALRAMCREVTLAAVLSALLDVREIESTTLQSIGREIHQLWVAQKKFNKPETICPTTHARAESLISTLRDTVSRTGSTPPLIQKLLEASNQGDEEFNTLNILIPSFETMWRVVLYTLLSCLPPSRQHYMNIIRDSSPGSTPSRAASAIVEETLRLYPPTRRVRREGFPAVDLEALQRDKDVWGEDAEDFRPERFISGFMGSEKDSWLPFSTGPMQCPAAGGYAIRMVVVIASEISRSLTSVTDWGGLDQLGSILINGRDEYEGVRVQMGV